jgi:D-inositol-3-phosphate glycosyltransferase
MHAGCEYPSRVAMISMHTSPLATPGVGDAGGLNVYVAELARRLGERGLKVDVFTRRDNPEVPEIVDVHEHTRVIHLKAGPAEYVPKEALHALTGEFCAELEVRLDGHDLIHSHYWLSGEVGLELKCRLGLPLVHTMHTMARVKNSNLGAGQAAEPHVRVRGEAAIVHGADVLTANTSDEAAELRSNYGARNSQIKIVPPGVDLHTFHPCNQPKSRAHFGVAQEVQVILFVGRIQPLKAPDVLIKAVAELVRRDPDRPDHLQLIIIGGPSGSDAEWSKTLGPLAVDHGISEMVDFRPHSERSELFRWYCVSDVVAVPSYNESFGLVALEAQACGRPVVATDVGGLRQTVLDRYSGLLVKGHDQGEWADALATILDDHDERIRMGANAAAHAATFSWDNTAAATLQAYRAGLRASLLNPVTSDFQAADGRDPAPF